MFNKMYCSELFYPNSKKDFNGVKLKFHLRKIEVKKQCMIGKKCKLINIQY